MDLRQHLNLIAVIGASAPLLGLLGTVLGMMQSFDALTASTGSSGLADGISKALISTQAGLLVALPLLLLHRWLSSSVEYCVDESLVIAKKIHTALGEGY